MFRSLYSAQHETLRVANGSREIRKGQSAKKSPHEDGAIGKHFPVDRAGGYAARVGQYARPERNLKMD
jgi:hypothetical protein